MMKKFKHILIPVFIVASGIAALAASPRLRSILLPGNGPVRPPAAEMPVYDAKADSLFTGLADLCNNISLLNNYLMEGELRVIDQADTAQSVYTRFRYARRDSMQYYQLGDQEMLTLPGLYMNVDHSVKKIMLSPHMPEEQAGRPLIDRAQVDALKKEGYVISKETGTPYTTISLVSNRHISCREYRIAYDSAGLIRSTFMRTTDLDNPLDRSLDKLISMNVVQWQIAGAPAHLFRAERFIERKADNWAPVSTYQGYEIKYIY
jgi:hypothetical protein